MTDAQLLRALVADQIDVAGMRGDTQRVQLLLQTLADLIVDQFKA